MMGRGKHMAIGDIKFWIKFHFLETMSSWNICCVCCRWKIIPSANQLPPSPPPKYFIRHSLIGWLFSSVECELINPKPTLPVSACVYPPAPLALPNTSGIWCSLSLAYFFASFAFPLNSSSSYSRLYSNEFFLYLSAIAIALLTTSFASLRIIDD